MTQTISRNQAHEYEKKIQDLSENLEILQSNINQITDQKYKILQKLKDTQDALNKIKEENNKLNILSNTQKEEIDNLNRKYNDLIHEKRAINEKSMHTINTLQKEINTREDKIESLQSLIKNKDEAVRYYSVNQDFNQRSHDVTIFELEKIKLEKEELKEKIDSLERQLEDYYVNRKSESGLLLELEHLKEDNLRLLNLLKSTEEYKNFNYLAEDCSGGIMFVKGKEENKVEADKPRKRACSFSGKVQGVKQCKKKEYLETTTSNDENWVQVEVLSIN